jgi:hypothetical protein
MSSTSFSALARDAQRYIHHLYGGEAPEGESVSIELAHALVNPHNRRLMQILCISVGDPVWIQWTLWVHWPVDVVTVGVPILLSPDACWPHCVNPLSIDAVNSEGVALACFNRLDIAHDRPDGVKSGLLYSRWPAHSFGAITAWAWGLQRCADALERLYESPLGVVGHSRGGKASLLAGALDQRFVCVVPHNSGTGGAASMHVMGAHAEQLSDLCTRFPHWLGPQAGHPDVQEEIQALDGVAMLAAMRDRTLCVLQASDDGWANPEGTRYRMDQLRPYWITAPDRLQLLERTGGHAMQLVDWTRAARALVHGSPAAPCLRAGY